MFNLHNIGYLSSSTIKKVHFIGIGGISMSGLAEILQNDGYLVSGSDMKSSLTTDKLASHGISIFTTHSESNITNPDLVVYTAAIKKDNPELKRAIQLGIPCIDRASLLGELMDRYEYPIAISGTHGKTTTTSMVTSIMIDANTDPTVHIGGILPAINDSTLVGGSKYFVTEACEYVESFLKFNPYIAVILNIEADHLDYFRDVEHVKEAFVKFSQKIPKEGYIVANIDDDNVVSIMDKFQSNTITYGINNPAANWQAREITFNESGCPSFSIYKNNQLFGQLTLSVPGIHNVSNSLAAIATTHTVIDNLSISTLKSAFESFRGANRRFELKGFVDGIKVVDDYAHHPTEIKATLTAAKEANYNKLFCVFQPHTYTRTRALLDDFSKAFDNADVIVVSDIYAAREANTGDIHSSMLVKKLVDNGKDAVYLESFEEIVSYISSNATKGDLVITMGAGNIDTIADMFISHKFKQALI